MSGHDRFEDDESHQAPDTPVSGSREVYRKIASWQDLTDHYRPRNARKIVFNHRSGQRDQQASRCLRVYRQGDEERFGVPP